MKKLLLSLVLVLMASFPIQSKAEIETVIRASCIEVTFKGVMTEAEPLEILQMLQDYCDTLDDQDHEQETPDD